MLSEVSSNLLSYDFAETSIFGKQSPGRHIRERKLFDIIYLNCLLKYTKSCVLSQTFGSFNLEIHWVWTPRRSTNARDFLEVGGSKVFLEILKFGKFGNFTNDSRRIRTVAHNRMWEQWLLWLWSEHSKKKKSRNRSVSHLDVTISWIRELSTKFPLISRKSLLFYQRTVPLTWSSMLKVQKSFSKLRNTSI